MSFAPYAVLWVSLIAAAGICLLAARRKLLRQTAALVAPLLAFALWFFFRPDAAVSALTIAGRQWAVGETAWNLTGVALLLLLSALVYAALNPDSRAPDFRPAWLLGLAAAALPIVWAADDRSRILALAFFAAVSMAAHRIDWRTPDSASTDELRPALMLAAALFPMWLASVLPSARLFFCILAAAILLGVWPFNGRRRGAPGEEGLSLLLNGLPVILGAAVLSAGLNTGIPTAIEIAFATALGLLSLAAGLIRAWEVSYERLTEALSVGLAGLTLVAAVWAGDNALLAAVRLAVFVPVALTVVASLAAHRSPVGTPPATERSISLSPAVVGLAVVYIALAGLPLTAGFGALSHLYEAWRAAGGWVLMLVLVALLSLWLAAVYLTGRLAMRGGVADRAAWLRGGALLLPIIGLLRFDLAGLSAGAPVWIAIAIPAVAGLLLGRFVPGLDTLDELLRASLPASVLPGDLLLRLRQLGRTAADALADALAILDGEFGLLWLLGLLLLLLWIA